MKHTCSIVFLLGIALCCSCNSSTPGAASTSAMTTTNVVPTPAAIDNSERGRELFQQRCQACHGLSGNYKNNNAANLQLTKLDSLGIVTTIINGRGAMPMFKTVFADSDLAQLELYVKTLRK